MSVLNASRLRWRLLVLEALLWLTVAGLALRLLPFRFLLARLGVADRLPVERRAPPPSMPEAEAALRIGRAVRLAAHHLPWRALRLPQAIAVKTMLRLRGVDARLHLGGGPAGARARAWLTLGRLAITGGPGGLPALERAEPPDGVRESAGS